MANKDVVELIKLNLSNYVAGITQPSKGKDKYICPLCGSGSGSNGTGAFSINNDGITWKCFRCDKGGDIFDLVREHEGLTTFNEQFKKLNDIYGVLLEDSKTYKEEYEKLKEHREKRKLEEETQTDYTEYFIAANSYINDTDYWKKRGLSEDTVYKYLLGYNQNWRHPNTPNAPATPRLIIPTSNNSYLARDTREDIPTEQKQYSKSKVGKVNIFNSKALNKPTQPIFVVEGEIDALSIIEAGYVAIGLGSVSNKRKLIEILKNNKPNVEILLALDSDAAGRKASKEIMQELEALNIKHREVEINGPYKDANEALVQDRKGLEERLYKAANAEFERKKRNYLNKATDNYINEFMQGVSKNANTPAIPTYFNGLDKALDGGLYEGLYIVGAISSLGKTTIITQIADQVAKEGQDVLIFSLEMARTEIMAKSISRLTAQIAINEGKGTFQAKTARGITDGKRYEKYRQEEKDIIKEAVERYYKIAKHVYIDEGVGDIGVKQIRDTIEEHIKYTGNKPIVIIDYLQILAPYSERMSDKQNTDKAVLELKRISRDFKIPLIGISSFNREGYSKAVTMEAFKESGNIEYSSDVLIGLQLRGAGEKDFDPTEAKKKEPREVELVILKNRNGRVGDKISFKFYPMFNLFVEIEKKGEY